MIYFRVTSVVWGQISDARTRLSSSTLLCLLPASSTRQPSGHCAAAARHPPATAARSSTAVLIWRLTGQHVGTPPVRPEPAGSSDILQRKLLHLSKTSRRTGTRFIIQQHVVMLSATFAKMNPTACVWQVVTALGKVWHPEHFVCTECEAELGSRNFFEKDGRPYCESDYFTLFSPHCANCSKPILNVSRSDTYRCKTPNQSQLLVTLPSHLFFCAFRKWSPLLTRTGTLSVSAVSNAAARSETKVSRELNETEKILNLEIF